MNTVRRKHQQGLALIELMIAMTLGLLVVGALIMLFANSKETYLLNENLARLQENGRFAMHLVSRDLRWADYRGCLTQDLLANAITGANNSGLNSSDSVTIVYQPNDCLNSPNTTVTMAYTVDEGTSGRPSLYRSIDGGPPVELVEDISDLQILYGEDTDNDDIPNYYVELGSISDPEQIVSVRMALTTQTPNVLQSNGGNRMSRDFASTIVLRNRIP